MQLLPLYTTDEGGSVLISSDTWPSEGGVLGLTRRDRRGARQGRAAAAPGRVRVYVGARRMRCSSIAGTIRPSGSTMCICGRRTRSAHCSGTRST